MLATIRHNTIKVSVSMFVLEYSSQFLEYVLKNDYAKTSLQKASNGGYYNVVEINIHDLSIAIKEFSWLDK